MKTMMTSIGLALGLFGLSLPAFGVTIISQVGDEDGFGIPGTQTAHLDGKDYIRDLGGEFFRDYRTADDLSQAPHSDHWYSTIRSGSPIWTHVYDLGNDLPVSAHLDITVAGIADISPVALLADGTPIYTFNFPGQGTTTHVLRIPVPLPLIDGSTEFSLLASNSNTPFQDNFIIDFTRLTITTQPKATVPEPSTELLLGSGLLGLGAWKMKQSSKPFLSGFEDN